MLHTPNRFFQRAWLTACALLTLIPLTVIFASLGEFNEEIWTFLLEFQLPHLIGNTVVLTIGVGIGVIFIGTSTAWLTAMFHFPLRRFLFWAMMLPLAVPAYVLAFTQLGIFDYASPISTYLREHYDWEHGLPEIRHTFGLIVVMSLTLYPYVYLLARNAFCSMGQRALEVGASLGLPPVRAFFQVALPMARPWIGGGAVLAIMETLADFGTVSVFVYDTFTTAIYQAWFDFYSIQTAKQLAAILITAVFILLVLEQISRSKQQFHTIGKAHRHQLRPLNGTAKWLATGYCSSILLFAFLIPLIQLCIWAWDTRHDQFNRELLLHAFHSLTAALTAALLVAVTALLLALSKRNDGTRFARIVTRFSTLGYAIPGSVLAVGVFVPVAFLDNWLLEQGWFEAETDAIFKGTLAVMLIAYLIRFLAVGYTAMESGLERIGKTQIEAAHSLGCTGIALLKRIYLPLLKGACGTAMLMTFVDVMKEMPITLMTRPYDWDTLAVRIYAFTTEGQYTLAAWPALLIVLTGLLPIILFSRMEYTK